MNTIIYGTGNAARNVIRNLEQSFNIIAIADSDDSLQGKECEGYSIIPATSIHLYDYQLILICSQYYKEIKQHLLSLSIPSDKILTATLDMKNGKHGLPKIEHYQGSVNFKAKLSRAEDRYLHLGYGVEYSYLAGVDGDIAEFGCGSGVSTHAIVNSLQQCELEYKTKLEKSSYLSKNIHLFDSFEGLPSAQNEIDKVTPDVQNLIWSKGKCFDFDDGSLKFALQNQLGFDGAKFYVGWYENTLNGIPAGTKFSFLHLDCDLYQSTYEVLQYLIENKHISEGALLYFDDWSANKASPKLGQRKAWADILEKYNITWSEFGFYGNGCKKIIVHEY